MGERDAGCRAPPGERRQLATALASVALNPDARPAVPYAYALDQLARRWSTRPDELEEMDPEWLLRGLEFQRMEASVKVTRGK